MKRARPAVNQPRGGVSSVAEPARETGESFEIMDDSSQFWMRLNPYAGIGRARASRVTGERDATWRGEPIWKVLFILLTPKYSGRI